MNRFENSLEHLMAELQRIDLRLRLQVLWMRQRNGQHNEDEFRGLYISEEEIDGLVAGGLAAEEPADQLAPGNSPLAVALRRSQAEIASRKTESLASGVSLRLCRLADEFSLSAFELDTLLVCLLPEIDTKYERLCAYLHDDVTRKRPSVNLALQCLLDSLEARVAARDSFLPQAPLIAHHLLQIDHDSTASSPSLLSRNLRIEDRVADYLLGSDRTDHRLGGCVRLTNCRIRLEDMILTGSLKNELSQIVERPEGYTGTVVYLQGHCGVGKKTAAEALCQSWGLPLLMVDVTSLLADDLAPDLSITLAFREAKLQGSAICWASLDPLLSDDKVMRPGSESLIRGMIDFSGPVLATGEAEWHPGSTLADKSFVRIDLPLPPYATREQLWDAYLNGHSPMATDVDLAEVADKFRFTPAQIRDAAATARNLAMCRGAAEISESDLYSACRVTSNQRLGTLARKIQPRFTWQDIVLPRDQMAQLREIANYVRYRHVVYGEWNFEGKVSLGRGLNILFAGPSGTGKTMAAEIIASELGLDLYKIDLSTVVSKYIGETEKNLDKIFTEAQHSNAILFFDEADAVFGKRSEVRDSHDRYANIEIAYLLQKTEEYDGIVILATNLRKNLDEAFARRMHFSVEFPLPEEPDRYRIWQGIFPKEAPLSEDTDLKFMARQFKITGGNIKNIAVAAAFLAAENGGGIGVEQLIRATKREYQKIGRLCDEADFGPYFDLVKG